MVRRVSFNPLPRDKTIDLEATISQLKSSGVTAIVTAINNEEMQKKGVSNLGEVIQQQGLSWYHLGIEDDKAPDNNLHSMERSK